MDLDSIKMSGLQFFGYHGVLSEVQRINKNLNLIFNIMIMIYF